MITNQPFIGPYLFQATQVPFNTGLNYEDKNKEKTNGDQNLLLYFNIIILQNEIDSLKERIKSKKKNKKIQ